MTFFCESVLPVVLAFLVGFAARRYDDFRFDCEMTRMEQEDRSRTAAEELRSEIPHWPLHGDALFLHIEQVVRKHCFSRRP